MLHVLTSLVSHRKATLPRKLAPLSPVLMERSRRSGKSSATAARAAEDCATAAATTASGAGRATGGGWLPAPRGKPPAAKKQPTPGGVGGGRSDTLPRAAQGAAQAAGDVASPPRAHREAQASMPAVLTTMLLSKPAQLYIWSMWALLREANAEHTKSPARRACEASTLQRSVWLSAVATAVTHRRRVEAGESRFVVEGVHKLHESDARGRDARAACRGR